MRSHFSRFFFCTFSEETAESLISGASIYLTQPQSVLRKAAAFSFPSLEEAEEFLEENFAVVVNSLREVWDFFEEEGIDMDGADEDEILNADEVFEIGDGRYLIVEA